MRFALLVLVSVILMGCITEVSSEPEATFVTATPEAMTAPAPVIVPWALDDSLSEEEKGIVLECMADWNAHMNSYQFVLDQSAKSVIRVVPPEELPGFYGFVLGSYAVGYDIRIASDAGELFKTIIMHELGHIAVHRNDHVVSGIAVMAGDSHSTEITQVDLEFCGKYCH